MSQIIHLNDNDFEQQVLHSGETVFVDFFASWCGPCQMMAPIVEELAQEYEGKAKICKVNVDDAQNVTSKYDVMSIPTMIIFKNGEPVDKIVGFTSKNSITQKMNHYL